MATGSAPASTSPVAATQPTLSTACDDMSALRGLSPLSNSESEPDPPRKRTRATRVEGKRELRRLRTYHVPLSTGSDWLLDLGRHLT